MNLRGISDVDDATGIVEVEVYMKTAYKLVLLSFTVCVLLIGPVHAQVDDSEASQDEQRTHSLAGIPALVLAAAQAQGPDVFFNSAVSYLQDDFRVYRVSGRLYRQLWYVYVREDGKWLRTQKDNQDD